MLKREMAEKRKTTSKLELLHDLLNKKKVHDFEKGITDKHEQGRRNYK
ncbi:hypothetical protein [Paenibacillus solani]